MLYSHYFLPKSNFSHVCFDQGEAGAAGENGAPGSMVSVLL